MGRGPFRTFAATFAIAAGLALAAWLAADVLMNLDELFEVSDAGGDPVASALRRYGATFPQWGPRLLLAIAAGAAVVATIRSRRVRAQA